MARKRSVWRLACLTPASRYRASNDLYHLVSPFRTDALARCDALSVNIAPRAPAQAAAHRVRVRALLAAKRNIAISRR